MATPQANTCCLVYYTHLLCLSVHRTFERANVNTTTLAYCNIKLCEYKKTLYEWRVTYFIILNCKRKSRMQPFVLSVYTMFHSWVQWKVTKSKVAKLVP